MESKGKLSCFERMVFKDMVHLKEQLSHDGGEGDFGGFAGQTQALIELAQRGVNLAGHHDGTHIESAADDGAPSTDVALTFPRAALPRPGSQSREGGSLLTVEMAQFRHLCQDTDGGDISDTIELGQGLDLLEEVGRAGEGLSQFLVHRLELGLEVFEEFGLLFADKGQGGQFAMLTSPAELFLELITPLDEGTQFPQEGIRLGCWRRLEGVTVGGEHLGVEGIALGPPTLSPCEVTDLGGVDHTDEQLGCMERIDESALIATGGFADDMDEGKHTQAFDQLRMALGGVGQLDLAVLEVELEGGLGDVQADIDCGVGFRHKVRSVRAQSCTYEHVVFAAAQSTVRVTDIRHERLRLPHEHVETVLGGNEHARAAGIPPAGGMPASSSCPAFNRARKMKMDIQG